MNRTEYLHKVKELLPKTTICIEIGVYQGYFALKKKE